MAVLGPKYLFIRAVADTKRNSEPLTKVVSYCKRIILRPISTKLVFLYHDLLSIKALHLIGLYLHFATST